MSRSAVIVPERLKFPNKQLLMQSTVNKFKKLPNEQISGCAYGFFGHFNVTLILV
jgi:hypothetical protein